jgi:hypothetical protein
MPNFVADEIDRRYHSDDAGKPWRLDATIEDEITVKDDRLSRRSFGRNGKPWSTRSANVPSDFGLRLKSVFDPPCPTRIEFAGREEADGKPILVYLFRSPPDGCFGGIGHSGNAYNAAVTGRILVEASTGNVIRCEWEGSGFPEKFGVDWYMQTESWNHATIGGSSYLVQASHDFVLRKSDGSMERVTTEYKNHRHFEASTNVTFH